MSEPRYPDATTRRFLTATIMAATVMVSLDTTIANVALPHMQGSVSASQDEITWVLTSYIVASAIMTPMSGWLADRFGRKRVMTWSIISFTIASGLCGIATNLDELVLFRMLQGVGGAALVPLSQAILLDINPPEKHGSAMSVWAMGAVLGPIVGPVLGGWLTENMTWRWCFYINVPVGLLAVAGISIFFADRRVERPKRFDLFGFGALALAVGILQLMLDRGQQQDWFSSTEICIEAGLSAFFFYVFVTHILTARNPFISVAIFKDVNFTFSTMLGFVLGVSLFSILALLPPMLERLLGYSALVTGWVMSPRGIGTMISMGSAGFLMRYFDARLLVMVGLGIIAFSMYGMSGFSLDMASSTILLPGILSGIGSGLAFVPLSVIAFATLTPTRRNEGAAIFTLVRNMGSAIGISILQAMTYRNTAQIHSRLVEGVRPDNPVTALRYPHLDFGSVGSLLGFDGEITRQASMVAYSNTYFMLAVVTVVSIPLVLLMKPPRGGGAKPTVHLD